MSEPVVYDPTEAQLRDVEQLMDDAPLTVADVAKKPEAVRLLVRQLNYLLHEVQALKSELSEVRRGNETLRASREELRVKLAMQEGGEANTFLEIPISILTGFAINILTSDKDHSWGAGLLILSLVMLVIVRRHTFTSWFAKPAVKEDDFDAQKN